MGTALSFVKIHLLLNRFGESMAVSSNQAGATDAQKRRLRGIEKAHSEGVKKRHVFISSLVDFCFLMWLQSMDFHEDFPHGKNRLQMGVASWLS